MVRNCFLTVVLVLSTMAGTVTARDYNILSYGAKADTTVLSTQALQQAIDDSRKLRCGATCRQKAFGRKIKMVLLELLSAVTTCVYDT